MCVINDGPYTYNYYETEGFFFVYTVTASYCDSTYWIFFAYYIFTQSIICMLIVKYFI